MSTAPELQNDQTGFEQALMASGGGVAARHGETSSVSPVVAPTHADGFNTIRSPLVAIACWRVDDMRFEFGSSFVLPGTRAELQRLAKLVATYPHSPLSIFGHADPIGQDESNKTLSGRRAAAIYGLLTRDVDLWEELYSQPAGSDRWGDSALHAMHDTVASVSARESEGPASVTVTEPPPASPISNATQTDADADIAPYRHDAATRRELFRMYMDSLCGPSFVLDKHDFLGGGRDAGGRGDYQGCGEFNPLLIFSEQAAAAYADPAKKAERNADNAPNRRVLVLLFRPGSKIDPARWPCPRAGEGASGCRKRFWSDGEKRRTKRLPDAARKHELTRDTFACRFYDRLTDASPCERAPAPLLLRFRNESDRTPLEHVEVVVQTPEGERETHVTDARGEIMLMGHPGAVYRVLSITKPNVGNISLVEHESLGSHA